MTVANRIRLTQPAEHFTPTEAIAYVGLLWWDETEAEGQRDPVLVPGPDGMARTYVGLFPSDGAGMLDADALRRGEVVIASWDLDGADLAALRHRHGSWPLDRFDLLVHRTAGRLRLWPVQGPTLRTAPALSFLDLDRRLDAAIRAADLAA